MNKLKFCFGFLLVIICISLVLMQTDLINFARIVDFSKLDSKTKINYKTTTVYYHSILDNVTIDKVDFNITKDLISLLHIPKTGILLI